ncbi:MAG: glucosamine-6-phosphate deaminase [Bifidobacteriaceae bacterium]|nr:glucosamine-6-phosphate deaminase [Bifidobacteriaceae bacterium]MCI1914728.1 glucosamine-6-phosphate deaminase [Bifidobacteriaceae bacterium]
MTEVIIAKSEDAAGEIYAKAMASLIASKPNAVLGLATGSSPLTAYKHLAAHVAAEHLDVSQVRGFALDEYVGLGVNHEQSYHATINRTVTEPLGLNPEFVHVPNGDLSTIQTAGADYDAAIEAAGGVDCQILGIGTDGHIGFNEPGSSLVSGTRIKTLLEQTREDNKRFFTSLDEVPTHAITQGIGTILRARHLVLLAFGESKAPAIAAAVEGGISSFCPASALQLHPRATVIVDEAAASQLKNLDYYKYAVAHKPAWQGI